jgi:hypothetical protein
MRQRCGNCSQKNGRARRPTRRGGASAGFARDLVRARFAALFVTIGAASLIAASSAVASSSQGRAQGVPGSGPANGRVCGKRAVSRNLDYSGSMSLHEEVSYLRNRCRRLETALTRIKDVPTLKEAQHFAGEVLKPGQANIFKQDI